MTGMKCKLYFPLICTKMNKNSQKVYKNHSLVHLTNTLACLMSIMKMEYVNTKVLIKMVNLGVNAKVYGVGFFKREYTKL